MAVEKVEQLSGLVTAVNELKAEPGGMVEATNVVCRSPGIVEPRRGFTSNGQYTFGGLSSYAGTLLSYQDTPLVAHTTNSLAYLSGTSFQDYSANYEPAGTALWNFVGAKNLYIATSKGVYVTDALTSDPIRAGVSQPADSFPVTSTTYTNLYGNPGATGSWLPENSSVSFRVVFGYYDANKNFKLSAPNGRFIVRNPAPQAGATVAYDSTTTTRTVTTLTAHGLNVGDVFNVTNSGATTPVPNTTNATVVTVASPTIFTYSIAAPGTTGSTTATISSGTKQVRFAFPCYGYEPLPNYFYRIYRTVPTSSWTADPGDEHYLCYEKYFTAADLTNDSVTVVIDVPAGVLGPPLYTNPNSGEGILQSNYRPPYAKDITYWNECAWFANTKQLQTLQLSLIGVGAPNGFQGGPIAVANTGVVANSYTLGTPTQNIVATAQNIVSALNRAQAGSVGQEDIKAYYVGDPSSGEGNILVTRFYVEQDVFSWGAAQPTAFNPQLANTMPTAVAIPNGLVRQSATTVRGTTSAAHGFVVGDTVVVCTDAVTGSPTDAAALGQGAFVVTATPSSTTFEYAFNGANGYGGNTQSVYFYKYDASNVSDNLASANRVYYSKLGQPEACPIVNYLEIGAANKSILRIVPLGDQLFVFKEDGLFVVSGLAPYRVDAFDLTSILLGARTVAEVDNSLYALMTKGVVRIDAGGVRVISGPIQDYVDYQIGQIQDVLYWENYMFAVGSELDQEYILFLELLDEQGPTGDQTVPANPIVFNTKTGSWVQWGVAATCGTFTSPQTAAPFKNKLLFGTMCPYPQVFNAVSYERKSRDSSDYADENFSKTFTTGSVSGTVFTGNSSSTQFIEAGDKLVQGGQYVLVTGVDTNVSVTGVCAAGASFNFANPFTVYKAYPVSAKFVSAVAGDATNTKHYSEATAYFRRRAFYSASLTFDNATQAASDVEIVFSDRALYAAQPLGSYLPPQDKRVLVPRNLQQTPYLNVGFEMNEALAYFALNGYALYYTPVSERNSR